MIRILALLIGLFLFNSLHAQEVKKIDWKRDINLLKKELPAKHVNLFSTKSKSYYIAQLDAILSEQKKLTNFEVAVKLQQHISKFGDTHTNISWSNLVDQNNVLPIHLYWFSDGIYILQSTKEYQQIIGTKITKINQVPINIIIDSLSTMFSVDNMAMVESKVPKLIPYIQLLEYFKFGNNSKVTLETQSLTGKIESFEIEPLKLNNQNKVRVKMDSAAFYIQNEKEFFIDKYFDLDEIYYIQYNKCFSSENPPIGFGGDKSKLPSFINFQEKVLKTINNKPIKKLVVDLRFNGGGNSYQGTEFIKKLSKIDKISKQGVLYVIIGRQTFSSAIINAMQFRELMPTIFVGEETSGKPNHFGNIKSFKLPKSGIVVTYSTNYYSRTAQTLNTITPDFTVKESFDDFKAGIDPVFEWIKKQ